MFSPSPRAFRRGPFVVLLFLTLAVTGATWQFRSATGRIKGSVRDSAGAPIQQAQVLVVGTPLTTVTDSLGRYTILAVARGTYQLRVQALGYNAATQSGVVVRDSGATTVDFVLRPVAVALQDLVTTANAQQRQRRALGNALTSVGEAKSPQPSSALAQQQQGQQQSPDWNTESYATIDESRFLPVVANPRSTFSIDVDAGSYTNVRRFLTAGQRPPKDAVRIEEFLNYFRYDYPEPRGATPFSVTADVAVAPWAPEHRLLRIGVKGKSLHTENIPPSNLVFLIDVSGSMQSPDKLPLVKQAFRLLVQELRPEDRVAIVVYAGAAGLVLPPTPGSDKAAIFAVLDQLEAGGSTAGGAGLRLAYDIAQQFYSAEGNNRVILATDGDFNVGESSDAAMVRLIEERRDRGIFLTVLGFGTGNLKDSKMEQIANRGNGNYAYVDNLREARRVFVREFAGTLVTIAKDVKIQVEFNPAKIAAYRLIGYENRALRTEDFVDDRKDAGELGAGHTVTALYELVPVGVSTAGLGLGPDSLKYQRVGLRPGASRTNEWLTVQLRYKAPTGTKSRSLTYPVAVSERPTEPAGDFRFAAAVAAFGMVLRDSEYKGSATLDQVLSLARTSTGEDPDGERAEFVRLIESARVLAVAEPVHSAGE